MLMSVWVHDLLGLVLCNSVRVEKGGVGAYIPAHASPPGNKQERLSDLL